MWVVDMEYTYNTPFNDRTMSVMSGHTNKDRTGYTHVKHWTMDMSRYNVTILNYTINPHPIAGRPDTLITSSMCPTGSPYRHHYITLCSTSQLIMALYDMGTHNFPLETVILRHSQKVITKVTTVKPHPLFNNSGLCLVLLSR